VTLGEHLPNFCGEECVHDFTQALDEKHPYPMYKSTNLMKISQMVKKLKG
jgi:hypothetical protein